jgi:hypothetical protein
MRAVTVRFTDESVKPDDAEDHRALNRLEVLYEAAGSTGRPPISQRATSRPWWLASTGVIGIFLRFISARSASIFGADEQSFAGPA